MGRTADVIVVGGGIIGCATAAELASVGADVLLLERREIAHGASGRNHGLLFYPQNQVTAPVYTTSRTMYADLADASEINLQMDYEPRGFVICVETDDQWAAAEAEAMACRDGGVAVERWDQGRLRAAEPNIAPDLLGGWFIKDGFRLDPAALTLALAQSAVKGGAEVLTNCEVKQVLVQNDAVKGVAADQGNFYAPKVVDAAGPWASKLARTVGNDLPITGARGWLLLTRVTGPLCNHLLESAGWHLTADDPGPPEASVEEYATGRPPPRTDVGMLIQQNQGGHVLLGGSRLATLREEAEGHEVTMQIAARAIKAVPALGKVPLAAVWSGVRPMSRDGLPLIGWLPGIEGFFVAGGHGGQGIILGGGTGRLAAQMINGSQTFTEPSPFRPDRKGLA